MLKKEVEVEVDGIVKCQCGNDGDAKIGQGSTGVANIDIPYQSRPNISQSICTLHRISDRDISMLRLVSVIFNVFYRLERVFSR